MASIKFTDSTSQKGKRIRLLIHFINVIVVTFSYVLLVHRVGAELGIDVDRPLREYETSTVFIGLASMLLALAILYGISFKLISWLFFKLGV